MQADPVRLSYRLVGAETNDTCEGEKQKTCATSVQQGFQHQSSRLLFFYSN